MLQTNVEKITQHTNDVPVQVQHMVALWEDDFEIRKLFLVEQVGDVLRNLGALLLDHLIIIIRYDTGDDSDEHVGGCW